MLQTSNSSLALIGPIRVSQNCRYFVDGNQHPFFWSGDTAWPLFAQYSLAEARQYLENRAQKGFNVIQGVLAWGGGTGYEELQPLRNCFGDRPWVEGPNNPNEAYFQHVDAIFKIALEAGVVLAVLPIWGYYVNDTQTFNPDNARKYGKWLGQRLKNNPNLIWINGGDRIATGFENTYRALAYGLREGDSGSHLISFHPCGWHSSANYFHKDDWLDFNMIQTWTDWAKVYPAVLADTFRTPLKPVILAEGAYEDGPEYPQGPVTPLVVRRQAWWTFMAGGYFTYGQNQMWRMETGWTQAFDTPGAQQMGILKRIVSQIPWWKRIPDQGLFASGISSERTLNTAVRSEDGDWALIYISSPANVQIHLDKVDSKQVKATWINPQTGEKKVEGVLATGNLIEGRIFPDAKKHFFSVPDFWEDALLLLESVC